MVIAINDGQSGDAGKGPLAIIKSEESAGLQLKCAGDVKDVHGSASGPGRFTAEAMKGVHKVGAPDLWEIIETTFHAILKISDLDLRLRNVQFIPEDFEMECVGEFCFLQFPDRKWFVL